MSDDDRAALDRFVMEHGPSCPDFGCDHEHCRQVRDLRRRLDAGGTRFSGFTDSEMATLWEGLARWLLMADVASLRDYARTARGVHWLDDAPDETVAEHIAEAREAIRARRLSWKQTAFETLERAIVGPTPQWQNHPDNWIR